MKTFVLAIAIVFAGLPGYAQFTKADLQATGLTCAMCSNAIYKALQAVPFVANVNPDIKNSAFHIEFKKDQAVEIDALKTAVEDAGFSVGALKITGKFDGIKIGEDSHVGIGKDVFHFLNNPGRDLNGEKELTVVDKDFVTAKQFKKISSSSRANCLKTGRAAECCVKAGAPAQARVYHVTI